MNQNPYPVAPNATRMGPAIIDLAPTILNYLGVPVPETMEGQSLL
jgi:bisphosphoglycerate-independent phosphoglycerate mutase (AlkP superfamily)